MNSTTRCVNLYNLNESDPHYRCKKEALEMNVPNVIGLLICLICIGGAWKIQLESGKAIINDGSHKPEATQLNPSVLPLELENVLTQKNLAEKIKIQSRKKDNKNDAVQILRVDKPFCDPENVTVPLAEPEDGITFWPTRVRLLRCGGCCKQTFRSCQPTVKRKYKVKVRRSAEVFKRHRNSKKHFYIDVEQHEACACKCIVNTECNSTTHIFDQKSCSCKCKNKDEMMPTCGSTHLWNDTLCRCECRDVKNCSKSEYNDHESCTCKSAYEHVFISGID